MQSLFTVQNELHVSLLSIHIAPSAWVAFLVIGLVFLYIYLPPLGAIRSWFFTLDFKRGAARPPSSHITPIYEESEEESDEYARPPRKRRTIETNPLPPLLTDHSRYDILAGGSVSSGGAVRKELPATPPRTPRKGSSPLSSVVAEAEVEAAGGMKATADLGDPIDASLEDFQIPPRSPPFGMGYPSTHSGFRSDDARSSVLDDSDVDSEASAGGYSPPAWRRLGNGDRSSGFWRQSEGVSGGLGGGGFNFAIPEFERESSPEYESADEGDRVLQQAARTRLPGSMSPEKERSPEPEFHLARQFIDGVVGAGEVVKKEVVVEDMKPENYIRFSVRAEVQQRTEPIDVAINAIRSFLRITTGSWASLAVSLLAVMVSWSAVRTLFEPASLRPAPDLVKVAGVARSFEPLIYYSEHGAQQVGELQATGVAVWDLGESVRGSNMTSAPIIVKELDGLSDSLKTLALELTKFFANVDGDIDSILLVMDWARRELSQLQHLPSAPFSTVFDNVHNMLSNAGILEDAATGEPTRLGGVAVALFGPSTPQRTRQTLQRTFYEFLAVLEEAINNELQHSLALFGLFEAIDQQFLNLARTVVRESSLQDDRHGELLSSLWTRILGARRDEVMKYEKNRLLLQNVREKTVRNKGILVEHNHKLMALKANLENLRRKLVSPLVRSVNGSTLTLEDQIRGLEDVGGYLEGVRTRQKGKLMEMLYGSGTGHAKLIGDEGARYAA
ncbi:hypothetical protein OQA88_9635 [Cercophora sp. LCS_1]